MQHSILALCFFGNGPITELGTLEVWKDTTPNNMVDMAASAILLCFEWRIQSSVEENGGGWKGMIPALRVNHVGHE